MTQCEISSLSVDGNVLKDKIGRIVAVVADELGPEKARAYAYAFASSSSLLAIMEPTVNAMLAGFEAQEKRMSGHRLITNPGITHYRGFPDWFPRAVHAVGAAKGGDMQPVKTGMISGTTLRSLSIHDHILKDDAGHLVANLSKDLGPDLVRSYAHMFAASIELLDIIDFTSSEELAEIEREYESGRQFNRQDNLPSEVSIFDANPPIIPDELLKARQIIARAKGQVLRLSGR